MANGSRTDLALHPSWIQRYSARQIAYHIHRFYSRSGTPLKVLIGHNSYQVRGGEDIVFEQETQLLQQMGHQVVEYRRSNDELKSEERSVPAIFAGVLWSREAYQDVCTLIAKHKPDIAHFHNTFPLISPAVYYACQANGIPVVQTLHNYRLSCLRSDLYRERQICTACLGTLPWRGLLHGCYRKSRSQTAAVASLVALHRLLRTWQRKVDLFITPSDFARRMAFAAGIPSAKVVMKPHFLNSDPGLGLRRGNYALFVGRLTEEKGVDILLQAWKRLTGLRLLLVGPESNDSRVGQLLSSAHQSNVEVLGQLPHKRVLELMKDAFVLILPSVLYETFGMAILEAFACGVPVICSDLGAMREIVTDHQTGLLFEVANHADLAEKVNWAFDHPSEMSQMGAEARLDYERRYSPSANYKALHNLYTGVLESRARAHAS